MKINEFLRDYSKNGKINIYDRSTYMAHSFHNKEKAIYEMGYYSVLQWNIKNDEVLIITQSQF